VDPSRWGGGGPPRHGSRDGAAGGLGVQPAGEARDGVGHVPAYGRRPVPAGPRYAARDGPEAVSNDGVGVGGVVERMHCDSLGVVVWMGATRV
jgi:hypothetical protein